MRLDSSDHDHKADRKHRVLTGVLLRIHTGVREWWTKTAVAS